MLGISAAGKDVSFAKMYFTLGQRSRLHKWAEGARKRVEKGKLTQRA